MPSPSSLSTFAAVGLAIAIAYLLVSTVCAGVMIVARSRRAGRSALRNPPGAFVAREIGSVRRRLRRHATAVLLFSVCFGVLVALGRQDLGPDLPPWGPVVIGVLVAVTAAFAAAKGVQLVQYCSRLRSLLDADLRVARQLDDVQRRGNHVFHAVPIGNRVIDHVIVGAIGVFAAQVVLPPRPGGASVSMARGSLDFGPGQGEFRLQPATEAFARLAKELARVVGHPVKVVPTLIAPGCRVSGQDDDRYLLTNEQHCVTLVGWKDSTAYLMDDEVTRIADWLSARCQPQRQWPWRFPPGVVHACVTRPGLL
jgi:hypothetical protein